MMATAAAVGTVGWAVVVVATVAGVISGARWIRVAQREHYLADSVSRFALRWWRSSPTNGALVLVALAGLVAAGFVSAAGFVTAAVVAVGPWGLSLRGRSSPLGVTRRLRTLLGVWLVLQVAVVVVGVMAGAGPVVAAAAALATPALVDVALGLTAPVERHLSRRYVTRAADRLRRVHPTVVAITGSYGKTTTKGYVAHLAAAARTVVASPASFNNRAGLARTINEQLVVGTEVFVAEMGTFGPGEIAGLCRWVPPDIAVITAIGPVHLERFKSEERIVEAKSEILVHAPVVVLAVDDQRLARLADRCAAEGKRVWRCSTGDASGAAGGGPDPRSAVAPEPRGPADQRRVVVSSGAGLRHVCVDGHLLAGEVASSALPGNVACAVAVALELGVSETAIGPLLATLPTAAHRLEPSQGTNGCVVLDDTYNSNPAGAAAALDRLQAVGRSDGRRVVVTPGMVELGPRQRSDNTAFAAAAARIATDIVVVGRTNRRALMAGARQGSATVHLASSRKEAVQWVRTTLGPDDAVLYENDLPDHYP